MTSPNEQTQPTPDMETSDPPRGEKKRGMGWLHKLVGFLVWIGLMIATMYCVYAPKIGDAVDARPMRTFGMALIVTALMIGFSRINKASISTKASLGFIAVVVGIGLILFFQDSIEELNVAGVANIKKRAQTELEAIGEMRQRVEEIRSGMSNQFQDLSKRSEDSWEQIQAIQMTYRQLTNSTALAVQKLQETQDKSAVEFERMRTNSIATEGALGDIRKESSYISTLADAIGGNRFSYEQIIKWSREPNSGFQERSGLAWPSILRLHAPSPFTPPAPFEWPEGFSPTNRTTVEIEAFYKQSRLPSHVRSDFVHSIASLSSFPTVDRLDLLCNILESEPYLPAAFYAMEALSLGANIERNYVDLIKVVNAWKQKRAAFIESEAKKPSK